MFRIVTVFTCSLLFVACASDNLEWDGVSCPDVGAVTLAKDYLNEEKGVDATIDRVRGACLVDDDTVETDLTLTIKAHNITDAVQKDVSLPLFTAVMDKEGKILQKNMYDKTITLPPSGKVAINTEEISVSFTPENLSLPPTYYHVVTGFQLDADHVPETSEP